MINKHYTIRKVIQEALSVSNVNFRPQIGFNKDTVCTVLFNTHDFFLGIDLIYDILNSDIRGVNTYTNKYLQLAIVI